MTKTKLFFSTILFFSLGTAKSSEFYEKDGKIYFEKWQINGVSFWTEAERNEAIKSLSDYNSKISTSPQVDIIVTTITPTNAETNLSTTTVSKIKIGLIRAKSKGSLDGELSEIKSKFDLYNDLDPTGAEAKDYKARYEWLKSYYGTLAK